MRRLLRLIRFVGWYAVQLVRSNLLVARQVLSPRPRIHPAVVPVSVRATSDLEVGVLTALIALTPGTLPLEIDREERVFVIHAMHTPTAEQLRDQISDLDDRLLGVLR